MTTQYHYGTKVPLTWANAFLSKPYEPPRVDAGFPPAPGYGSKAQRIREALEDGPMTTVQMADIIGGRPNAVLALMKLDINKGVIVRANRTLPATYALVKVPPVPRSAAKEGITAKLRELLEGKSYTAGELAELSGACNRRISALLRKDIDAGRVIHDKDRNPPRYSLAR